MTSITGEGIDFLVAREELRCLGCSVLDGAEVVCGQQDDGEGRGDERAASGIFSGADVAADEAGLVGDYVVDDHADAGDGYAAAVDEDTELRDG